jgi:hypothetical protein
MRQLPSLDCDGISLPLLLSYIMSNEASTSQQPAPANANQGLPSGPANAQGGGSSSAPDGLANGSAATVVEKENKEAQEPTEEELARLFTAKREEDMARRDRTLAEFLVMLDGYKPLVRLISFELSALFSRILNWELIFRSRRRSQSTTCKDQVSTAQIPGCMSPLASCSINRTDP